MDILLVATTLISLAVAGAMSFLAWRVVREERRRSEARVAALAVELGPADLDLPPGEAGASSAGSMFTFVQPVAALPRLTVVVLAGALVVGSGAVLLVAVGRGGEAHAGPASAATAADASVSAAPQTSHALELVALGHERERDQLTVRGVVRNPMSGSPITDLTAVVLVYDREGGFLTTGRAPLQTPALSPGGETSFLVTITGAAAVGRYRVSFRSRDRVISHVDLRS